MIRRFAAWLDYWVPWLAYRIRPYDMIADRRRWFWQKRTRCQFRGGRPWERP